jgi:hypothetical protein
MARTKKKKATIPVPHWTETANYLNSDGFQDRIRARNARSHPELFPGITPSEIPLFPTPGDVARFTDPPDLALFPPGMVEEFTAAAGSSDPEPSNSPPYDPEELYHFNDGEILLGSWLNDWWDRDAECWVVHTDDDRSITLPFRLDFPWEVVPDAAIDYASTGEWHELVIWRGGRLFATVVRDSEEGTQAVHYYQNLKPSE